jgi:hypothetical protein
MSGLYFFGIFIVGMLFLYLLIRKDYDENKSLTKKGFIKLLLGMGVMFIAAAVLVGVMV